MKYFFNYHRSGCSEQLPGMSLSYVAINKEENYLRTITRKPFIWGLLSGGNFPGGNYLGIIIRIQLFCGVIVWPTIVKGLIIWGQLSRIHFLVGQLSGEQLSGGKLSWGQLSGGQLSWRAVIRGAIVLFPNINEAIYILLF